MQKTISCLDDVSPDERGGYIETQGGGYELHPELVAYISNHESTLAAMKARAAKAEVRLRSAIIGRALDCALTGAGVAPAMRRAVAALLEADLLFDVVDENEGPQAYVMSPYGRVSVSNAVSSWLQSSDGAVYRPNVGAPLPGRFGEMMRHLRTMH